MAADQGDLFKFRSICCRHPFYYAITAQKQSNYVVRMKNEINSIFKGPQGILHYKRGKSLNNIQCTPDYADSPKGGITLTIKKLIIRTLLKEKNSSPKLLLFPHYMTSDFKVSFYQYLLIQKICNTSLLLYYFGFRILINT